MTTSAKHTPCPCDAFQDALRSRFVDHIGEELFLASREDGGGSFRSLLYGPKIAFCPFCGGSLAPKPS